METLYFLRACANDVYGGARYLGFTFTPGRQVAPTPTPAPLHEVATGASQSSASDRVVFTFNGIEVSMSRGGNVRMERGTAHLSVSGACEFTLRRVAKPARARRTAAPAATGTGGPAIA